MPLELEENEEIDVEKHSQLLQDVLNLNKRTHLEKPSRTEPTLEISEFNLVKSLTGRYGNVRVHELTNVLNKRAKHAAIAKEVNKIQKKVKTLPKPLEKPQAQRLKRKTAFENVKTELNRWQPVITSNRASNHLTFPLPTDVNIERGSNFTGFRLKSDLQQRLEALKPKIEEIHPDTTEEKYPLTMQEMLERRKEMAKMRAIENYSAAKAHRSNKIKSKRFHRSLRREKLKNQMKEFEELQKTNPDEALKRLEEIERSRATERASLRHHSTGKWAKNQLIRAKYDKENRQILAQQLAIGRDLTQKLKVVASDSGSEDEKEPCTNTNSSDNPWTNTTKTPNEVEEFVSGYRKFWDQQNSKETPETDASIEKQPEITEINVEIVNPPKTTAFAETKPEVAIVSNTQETKKSVSKGKRKQKVPKEPKIEEALATTEWNVSTLYDSGDEIENMFDDFDAQIRNNLQRKLKKIKQLEVQSSQTKKIKKSKPKQKKKKQEITLDLYTEAKRPIIDEPLTHTLEADDTNNNANLQILSAALNLKPALEETPPKINNTPPKIINLNTEIPEILTLDDNEENADQKGIISEAFRDDNIVDEFRKEKKAAIEDGKLPDINLSLPGWGSWGGTGIKPSKRKNKRFIIRFPKKFKRKDENKGNLIINEEAVSAVKSHLVSEVPFPFKTVKDFEASVRAPIGSTFVPEIAHRRMIAPAVKTKSGAIIEPMTEDVLLKKKK